MKLVYAVITLIALISCNNQTKKETKTPKIEGYYYINTISQSDVTNYNLHIAFKALNQEVLGFSGCNRFFGNYILKDNFIKFEPIASTKLMCPNSKNKIESNLLDALTNINSFSLKENKLVLKADTTAVITATLNSEKIE